MLLNFGNDVIGQLESNAIQTSTRATHQLLTDDPLSYAFPNAETSSNFYVSYMNTRMLMLQDSDEDDLEVFKVGEIASLYVPIIYRFDKVIEFVEDSLDTGIIQSIVSILQNVIRKINPNRQGAQFDNAQLDCIVLSRTRQEDPGAGYIDLWFQFPNAVDTVKSVEATFSRVSAELNKRDIMISGRSAKWNIARDIYQNPVPVFGSEENDACFAYYRTYTVNTALNYVDDDLDLLFPVEQCKLCVTRTVNYDKLEDLKRFEKEEFSLELYLPLLLSIHGHTSATTKKISQVEARTYEQVLGKFSYSMFHKNSTHSQAISDEREAAYNACEIFFEYWDPYRIYERSEWLTIGEAFFNIFNGEPLGIKAWKQATSHLLKKRILKLCAENSCLTEAQVTELKTRLDIKPLREEEMNPLSLEENFKVILKEYGVNMEKTKADVHGLRNITLEDRRQVESVAIQAVPSYLTDAFMDVFRKYYYSFFEGRATYRTIATIAREDSPAEYDLWNKAWVREGIIQSKDGSDTKMAIALYRFLWLDFICEIVTENKVNWFYLKKNKLQRDQGKNKLRKYIVGEFYRAYEEVIRQLKQEAIGLSKEQSSEALNIVAELEKILVVLHKALGKRDMIKESEIFFNQPGLSGFMNENVELTCVNTGIMVATKDAIYFRQGRLEDYVTNATRAHYLDIFSINDPAIKRLINWTYESFLKKNDDLVHWWWMLHASGLLRGGNDDKIFPFIHGFMGNEGKSAWTNLFYVTGGSYCIKIDWSYFMCPTRNANDASPVTARTQGARLAWLEESEDTKTIIAGKFKGHVSKDVQTGRQLYGEQIDITNQCTYMGVGNDVPGFSNNGLAVIERFAIVPIFGRRCYDAPDSEEDQQKQRKFKRDIFFESDLDYYISACLWLQVHYYGKYIANKGLRPYPKCVTKHTERYWMEKDKYRKFSTEMVEKTDNPKDILSMEELYEPFKAWHEKSYPKARIPNIEEVRREYKNKWNKPKADGWVGYKLKAVRRRGGAIRKRMDENSNNMEVEVN